MLKTIHKAMFFRSKQDKHMRRAFILRWMVDEEKEWGGFSIEPPHIEDKDVFVVTQFPHAAEKDFSNMVNMMKLMIQPMEVVVE